MINLTKKMFKNIFYLFIFFDENSIQLVPCIPLKKKKVTQTTIRATHKGQVWNAIKY